MSKWKEKLTAKLELPGELAEGVPRLTMTGDREVLVENRSELLSYSAETVEIGCGRTRLRIIGERLMLRAMDREELLISGKIFGVEVDGT